VPRLAVALAEPPEGRAIVTKATRRIFVEIEENPDHFETKWKVEERLRVLGLPLTVVRPAWFFENLGAYSLQPQGDGYAIYMPLAPERTLQGTAADDIGAFVTLAFADRDGWIGREVEIAGTSSRSLTTLPRSPPTSAPRCSTSRSPGKRSQRRARTSR
jgi:uncharacterized protein YbjT (DUF2867 family)